MEHLCVSLPVNLVPQPILRAHPPVAVWPTSERENTPLKRHLVKSMVRPPPSRPIGVARWRE